MDVKTDVVVGPNKGMLILSGALGWDATITIRMAGPSGIDEYKSEKQARTAANRAVDRVMKMLAAEVE